MGPAYLVQPVTTLGPLLEQELALVFHRLSFPATGKGEVSLGFARTREAPRSSGVGPAYLVQAVTTLRPLLEQELALELRRLSFASTGEGGGVTGVCSNQRSTTLSWRGPGVSGSTRDYLASPPRAGASARAPSTFLCFDWRRGGVAKFFVRTREAPRTAGVGPAYSDSTSDYLVSPPREGACARAPSTFLCCD